MTDVIILFPGIMVDVAETNLPRLRERVAAIVAEFDVSLPEGDAGSSRLTGGCMK